MYNAWFVYVSDFIGEPLCIVQNIFMPRTCIYT